GGRQRAGTIRGGAGPGRTVDQLLLSFRFLRLLLNQNYEPLPSRGRSVACPILAPGSSPSGSHDLMARRMCRRGRMQKVLFGCAAPHSVGGPLQRRGRGPPPALLFAIPQKA